MKRMILCGERGCPYEKHGLDPSACKYTTSNGGKCEADKPKASPRDAFKYFFDGLRWVEKISIL